MRTIKKQEQQLTVIVTSQTRNFLPPRIPSFLESHACPFAPFAAPKLDLRILTQSRLIKDLKSNFLWYVALFSDAPPQGSSRLK